MALLLEAHVLDFAIYHGVCGMDTEVCPEPKCRGEILEEWQQWHSGAIWAQANLRNMEEAWRTAWGGGHGAGTRTEPAVQSAAMCTTGQLVTFASVAPLFLAVPAHWNNGSGGCLRRSSFDAATNKEQLCHRGHRG